MLVCDTQNYILYLLRSYVVQIKHVNWMEEMIQQLRNPNAVFALIYMSRI